MQAIYDAKYCFSWDLPDHVSYLLLFGLLCMTSALLSGNYELGFAISDLFASVLWFLVLTVFCAFLFPTFTCRFGFVINLLIGISFQNTLPGMHPAENAHLQTVVAHQGAIIRVYQKQLVALQTVNEQLHQPQSTQSPPTQWVSVNDPPGKVWWHHRSLSRISNPMWLSKPTSSHISWTSSVRKLWSGPSDKGRP